MGRKSIYAETLGVHTRNEILAEIIARGESLNQKKGSYAALIFEWWFKQGCPPVTEADRLVQLSKKSTAKKAG